MNDSQSLVYVSTHHPLVVLGLLLMGASAAFSFHLLLRLEKAGDKSYREGISFTSSMWYTLPRNYRRRARLDGWPVWPVHMPWVCLLAALTCIAIGLFHWK